MRLPDVLPAEEQSRRWWKAWRAVDFSWASIGGKQVSTATEFEGETTLQAYWRADPASGDVRTDSALLQSGELEKDPHGNLWHLAHVPLIWDDGKPTWKADRTHAKWTQFWSTIRARLDVANPNELGDDSANEAVDAAKLSGVVFGTLPEDWLWNADLTSLNAEFATCAFLGEASFFHVESTSNLDFRYCLFVGTADFDRVEVKGDLMFAGAVFLSRLQLANATIAGDLDFSECNVLGEVSLVKSRVGGKLQCSSSVFHAPCLFEGTTFTSPAQFSWCHFLDLVSFASVRFRGDASFVGNAFATDVTFTGRCYGDLRCVDCDFEGSTTVAFMLFLGNVWFAACRFKQSAGFQNIRFRGKASFRNAVFRSDARFEVVGFCAEMEFHNTVFEDFADFTGCTFPVDAGAYQGAFRGADFRRNADFTIDGFTAWGVFIDTSFHQRLLLSRHALTDARSFQTAFEAADRAAVAESSGNSLLHAKAADRRFGELESAFQALKQAMAQQQARLDEHRFYRLELLARRRSSASSRIERGIIRLYDLTSRCGTSFVRPLVALAILIAVFALGYWASMLTSHQLLAALNPHPPRAIDATLVDALRFSVENTLQPMSVWGKELSEDDPREAWVSALLFRAAPIGYLGVRLAATLQSLLSIALLFLVVLGFKRHFQMNT